MMILADTSVWIDYLRGDPSATIAEFDRRLEEREALMCGAARLRLSCSRASG